MKKSADFLKVCRENNDLSQKDVAAHLGYSTSQFISNWERGLSQPPITKIRDLAKLYRVDVEVIFNLILEDHIEEVKHNFRQRFLLNHREEQEETDEISEGTPHSRESSSAKLRY